MKISKKTATCLLMIMSLESVFAALAGWVVLGQNLSLREIGGCVIIFAAIILAQLELKRLRKFR